MPSPGAANGVVPKNGIGIAFWIAGVPGSADIVKVDVPSATAAGISRFGMLASAEQRLRHRHQHEERDEQADAAVGDQRARQHDREDGAAGTQLFRHEMGDGRHRPAVVHQLAEHRAQQEQREELQDEARGRTHERHRPVREQRLARRNGRDQRRDGRQHQHAPAAKREPDEDAKTHQDTDQPHRC